MPDSSPTRSTLPTTWRCPHDGAACECGCACGAVACWRLRNGMRLAEPWTGFPVAGEQPVRADGEA